MITANIVPFAYLVATVLFIFSLRWMNDPKTARHAVNAGVVAMLIAVGATWIEPRVVNHLWIVLGIAGGVVIGIPLSRVPLTAVPQRTALSHAFGGAAAGLVGVAYFYLWRGQDPAHLTPFRTTALITENILGFLTFSGSLMAAGKLQEVKWIPQRPVTYKGQNVVNMSLLVAAVAIGIWVILHPTTALAGTLFPIVVVLALLFGILLIIPIGGADMPTVIAILNSYAGLSASALGFVVDNKLLVTAGALDGSSGLILAVIMCRAMNRSFTNVLFGAFGQVKAAAASGEQKTVRSATPQDVADLLTTAERVVIVPGYGMAVAQAQHRVHELYEQLTRRGVDVKFAIHPVAGRMPGHMNVLLAEAEIPYEALIEMEDINPEMAQTDVCLVVGANDVVNPAARHDKGSPIFGMPIIDADKARTIVAIKRSMNPGFAGIDNELYYDEKTLMAFGDAKQVLSEIVKAVGGEGVGVH